MQCWGANLNINSQEFARSKKLDVMDRCPCTFVYIVYNWKPQEKHITLQKTILCY